MGMRMIGLWKHPKSEKLWLRRRVPKDVVAFMGRAEIKLSLRTTDRKLAEVRLLEENAKLERLWHEHLNGLTYTVLTHRQISALAGEFYREMVEAHQDNPGKPHEWETLQRRDAERKKRPVSFMQRNVHLRFAFGPEVQAFLDRRGLRLSGDTLDGFVVAYLDAKEQAAGVLLRNANRNYKADPEADRFASPDLLKDRTIVPAFDMFERYAKEAQLAAKTRRSWKSRLAVLTDFVGHDDLARLTKKNMIEWKDDLLKERPDGTKLSPNTVRDGYIGGIKAMLNYAVEQEELPINVALGVTVRGKKKNREKGFTHEEALVILKATLLPPPRARSAENAAARMGPLDLRVHRCPRQRNHSASAVGHQDRERLQGLLHPGGGEQDRRVPEGAAARSPRGTEVP